MTVLILAENINYLPEEIQNHFSAVFPFSETVSILTFFCRCPFYPIFKKNVPYTFVEINFRFGGLKMTESKEKGTSKKRIGAFIIGNAIVWGLVIISTALVLRGTGLMSKLLPILGGGAGFSVVILSGFLVEKK